MRLSQRDPRGVAPSLELRITVTVHLLTSDDCQATRPNQHRGIDWSVTVTPTVTPIERSATVTPRCTLNAVGDHRPAGERSRCRRGRIRCVMGVVALYVHLMLDIFTI